MVPIKTLPQRGLFSFSFRRWKCEGVGGSQKLRKDASRDFSTPQFGERVEGTEISDFGTTYNQTHRMHCIKQSTQKNIHVQTQNFDTYETRWITRNIQVRQYRPPGCRRGGCYEEEPKNKKKYSSAPTHEVRNLFEKVLTCENVLWFKFHFLIERYKNI